MTQNESPSSQGEFVAVVEFRTTAQGGRVQPTSGDMLRCLLEIDGKNCDCALLLKGIPPVLPGQKLTVPIKLLDVEYALPLISVGKNFLLKDYRIIATGTVVEIHGP
jgi:hypothetical protein